MTQGADLFAAAARAAGAIALRADLDSGALGIEGDAAPFGIAATQHAAHLSSLRAQIAQTDTHAFDGLYSAGPVDVRLRLVGEDRHVRHVRLTGRTRDGVFEGMLLIAGAAPRGGTEKLDREVDLTRDLQAGRVIPFYQPIIDLDSGRLAGFEALARWRRPGESLVAPDDFLPLAAEMNLIAEVGARIREGAIRDLAAWQQAGLELGGLYIAANATAGEVSAPGFVRALIETIDAAGIPRDRFKLEINESELMLAPEAVVLACQALKEAGICLVIDDFGTGYSSLARLDQLPFDVLKIDQYFIRALGSAPDRNPQARSIVTSIVELARACEMDVVAEGVESAASADAVRQQGVRFAQGFQFGSAVPADEAEAWIIGGASGRFAGPAA